MGPNQLATLQNVRTSASVTRPTFPDPFPNFESWLDDNPNNYLKELQNEYSKFPDVASTIGRGFRSAIDYTKATGGQIAGNAATEAMARWAQSGGGGNSGMVKAQSMLPVYEQVGKLSSERGMAMAAATQKGAEIKANLAAEMDKMRMNYLIEMIRARIAAAGTEKFDQDASYLGNGVNDGVVGASTRGEAPRGYAPFQGQITRAPNNSGMGPVEFTPEFQAYMAAHGLSGSVPQYPQTAGVGSGPDLDRYMAGVKENFSLANGAPWFQQSVDQQAGLDTRSYDAVRAKTNPTVQQQTNATNTKAAASDWLKRAFNFFTS